METFLFLLELAGTVAFAVSGAVLGIEKHMDIFGVGLLQWLLGLHGAVLFCILLFALALLPLLAIDEARGVATARRADEGARAGV